jgi:hypothetical protein
MLDDIDYSDLTATSTSAAPTSEPKKKSNIAERSVVKKQDKPARKEVDVESLSEKAKEIQSDLGAPQIPDPLAQYGLPALGALGALGTAYGVYKSMQNKAPTPNAPMTPAPAAGPDYSAYNSPAYLRNAPVAPPAPVEAAPAPQAVAPALDRLQQAQQLAEANRQLGIGQQTSAPVVPPQFPPAGVPAGDIPPAPPYLPSTPFSAAPPDAPAPESSAGPNSATTSIVNNTVKEMIDEVDKSPQELRTGTGKPAFAGMGPEASLNKKGQPKFKSEYASIADVPSGYAFVPGADKIDTLRNILGQPAYTEAFKSRPFPLTNEMAIQEATEINRMLGRPTRAEMIAAGLTPAANTPGITQPTNPPKGSGMGTKATRVGGLGIGALVAIPELAKAQTSSERAMAGANLFESVLPPGFAMSGAGEGSSAVPSVDQALLLGSPYAQTEIAKKRRQQEEYTRKVGAGRGIAPPSAYLR